MAGRNLAMLAYADDIVLITRSRSQLSEMLLLLRDSLSSVGLGINASKTVLMTSCVTRRQPLQVGQDVYRFVSDFVYLGCSISMPQQEDLEITRRIQSGWLAFTKMADVLTNRKLRLKVRCTLFETYVTPRVLYGSESWSLNGSGRRSLLTAQRKMERTMLGVSLRDHVRSEDIRKWTKLKDWIGEADRRKELFARRISSMDPNRWTYIATHWTPLEGHRSQGRQALRWRDHLPRHF